MKLSTILGLNARAQLFSYPYNSLVAKRVVDSKLQTARLLERAKIPTPKIYKRFKEFRDVVNFDWLSLPASFALKPSRGMGGEGIIVVKKKSARREGWITTQKEFVTVDDLKLQALDIIEGAHSLGNVPDVAFIQEYVGRHKAFRRLAYRGTPDIRIIVFNKVPVMAMLRLPTKESQGRANLHQGAVGVGIDIATGITTKAIWHGEQILYKPGTKREIRGIKIPEWEEDLKIAVRSQIASGLGYLGVDVLLHPEKGPMVLELNGQPGLQIQLANVSGLKKRLEKVDDLEVTNPEQGVRIARELFSEKFKYRGKKEEGVKTIGIKEEIKIRTFDEKKIVVPAKIDTGAWRTSIDKSLAKSAGLLTHKNILWSKRVKSSFGREERPVINLTFWLKGKKIITDAGVADRSRLSRPVLVGRKDLSGFLVSTSK